jgi:transposase
VAQNFLPCDRDQELLLPPSLREWLPEDHLAWFVLEAVAELDLEAFNASYRRDGWGAAAHDPAMMVALLVYAYAIGERSSRAIERRCREDLAFRVITANQIPDHATVARFRVRHEAALGDLFGQVLGLCADAGLVSVGVIAVDGSKFAASASDKAIRTYEQIAAEIIEEAGHIDAVEDELHGPARGDELPEHLAKREGRRAWLREAKERLDRERAERAEPVPRGRAERLRVCQRRLVEDWRAERFANREYEARWERGVIERGRQQMGSGPRPFTPPARPEGKLNTTDPDARRMKQGRAFIPAYNAQAVTTEQQIVIAAEVTTEGVDFEQLEPMVANAERELRRAGLNQRPGVVLADAGYWSNGHIDALRERGMVPIVAPDNNSQQTKEDPARRPLRLYAQSDRHRAGRRALLTEAVDGRTRLRANEVESAHRSLQTQRIVGRLLRMAPDRRHAQLPQAPPPHPPSSGELTQGPAHRRRPQGHRQQQVARTLCDSLA